ncbi:MAG: DUF1684 domain-containing protein [Anaerolineae bacterium]
MPDLDTFRQQKDHFFAHSPHSPLMPEQRESFTGLTYYPENPDLCFEISLDLFDEQDVIEMQTTGGSVQSFTRWGRVHFEVDGEACALTLYAAIGAGGFFLPFKDATSGDETYGGGRYINVEPLPGDRYLIDFNKAYNPYCAYNAAWSCTIPPVENHLSVAIEAGEKLPDEAWAMHTH